MYKYLNVCHAVCSYMKYNLSNRLEFATTNASLGAGAQTMWPVSWSITVRP